MEGDAGLPIGPTVAQAQIRIIVAVLKMIRDFLQSILAALPLSAQERNPQADLDAEPGITSEIRGAVECALADCLNPMITALSAAAEYRLEREIASADREIGG
jgi:hypothetical protein